jgi:lipid II:glycine glycyltransferase (peptidoglycan interpeptide bridge formation enzyme)
VLLVPFVDTVIAKVNGWSGLHGDCRPNEAVYWGAIRWAKERGFRTFDFDGIDPAAARAVLDNQPIPADCQNTPTSFKLTFGGQAALYPPSYDYVFSPLLRLAYRAASPLFRGDSILLWIAARLRKRRVDAE